MAKKMTTNSVITATKPVETKVLTGMVVVVATDVAKYMKPGKEYPVTAQMAQTLIKNGFATLKE